MRQDDEKEEKEVEILSFGPIESLLYGHCSMFFCKPKRHEKRKEDKRDLVEDSSRHCC